MLPVSAGGTAFFDRQYSYSSGSASPRSIGGPCPSEAANNGNLWHIMDATNTSAGQSSAARNQDFAYDSLNRLTHWSTSMMAGLPRQMSFGYDSFGNLTQTNGPTAIPASSWFGANNRYLPGMFNCYGLMGETGGYDEAGNVLCQGDQNSNAQAFNYDAESQVIEAWKQQLNNTYALGTFTSYAYNGSGEREIVGQWTPTGPNNSQQLQSWREYTYFGGQPYAEKDNTGAWTDYIYANGKKIAKIAASASMLHSHGVRTQQAWCATDWWLGQSSPLIGYTVHNGDKMAYDRRDAGAFSGLSLAFSDGTYSGDTTDYSPDGDWHHLVWDLSPFAGKTVANVITGTQGATPAGTWDAFYTNLSVIGADGTVLPISTASPSRTAESCTDANPTIATENVPVDGTDEGTTYYLADQVGTTQMELSSGGWPIWKGEFAPFGQELDTQPTSMRYKFTGKERDTESGLDYFGARYYASSMGRFMSPDWADKPEAVPYSDLSNPQSLNLYGYVKNNPLSQADPDGHCCEELKEAAQDAESSGIPYLGPVVFGLTAIAAIHDNWDSIKTNASDVLSRMGQATLGPAVSGVAYYQAPANGQNPQNASPSGQTNSPSGPDGPYKKTPENEARKADGKAPIGKDGKPVELHHDGQDPKGPLKEMTRTEHRGGENFKKNHPNTGQEPSKIDRNQWNKDRKQYWKDQAKQ